MTELMSASETTRMSRMMSKTLRHNPARLGLVLDESGWVTIDALIAGFMRKGQIITRLQIEYVVAHNDNQRFAIDGDRIRAHQGHSVAVDLGLEPAEPPESLFHGTGASAVESILAQGLHAGDRHHVHLSADTQIATRVGSRHGRPVVFTVLSGRMFRDGMTFFCSANGVWLVNTVPMDYLRAPKGWH